MNLIERVQKTAEGAKIIAEWLGAGATVVSKELAQSRADICLKCPLNIQQSFITESIADAIRRQLALKSKLDLIVEGEEKLFTCSGCSCALKLKLWLPLKDIMPDPDEQKNFIPACWMLNNDNQYEIKNSHQP